MTSPRLGGDHQQRPQTRAGKTEESTITTLPRANSLLGYPPDARLLIVNADDFGLCHAQNVGTLRAIREGIAQSCSLMVPAPWALHGIELLRDNPDIPFAVHLTAISEYVSYRWRPLTSPERVPSLVDESGYFCMDNRIDQVRQTADVAELAREFRAQVEFVLRAGLRPTHLDSHYGVHELRPDIFDMTVDLALEYGLALRAGTQAMIARMQDRPYPVCDYPLFDSGRMDPSRKRAHLAQSLRTLPSGLSEWGMHPGIANEEMAAIMAHPNIDGVTATPPGRQSDLDVLTSTSMKDGIEQEGIILLSYRPLQKLWQQKDGSSHG